MEQPGPRGLLHVTQVVGSRSRSRTLPASPWTVDSHAVPQGTCAGGALCYDFQSALVGGPLWGRAVHVQKGHLTQQTQRNHQLFLNRGKSPASNCYSPRSIAWSRSKRFRVALLCGPNTEEPCSKPLSLRPAGCHKTELMPLPSCPKNAGPLTLQQIPDSNGMQNALRTSGCCRFHPSPYQRIMCWPRSAQKGSATEI